MSITKVTLDFETRSACDLKKAGAFVYSCDPTTDVICMSYKIGDNGAIKTIPFIFLSEQNRQAKNFLQYTVINDLLNCAKNPDYIFVAHNAFFEQVIYKNVLVKRYGWPEIPIERWRCTAAKAAACALPRNLENACLAINLPIKKDMDGRRLILKYCKPRKTKDGSLKWWDDENDFKRIIQYCEQDVAAEYLLDNALPDLHPDEQVTWFLDQKINMTGVRVDTKAVDTCLELIQAENRRLQNEVDDVTGGILFTSVRQRNEVLNFIRSEGYDLPDLRAKTVQDALNEGLISGDAKIILELRQITSKTSTAKYSAFKARAGEGSRVRDLLLFNAASTGRWGGMGIQPQNFPRGSIKDTDAAIDVILDNDLEWLRFLYGNPMEVFSSCLRGMITATPGKTLYVADYASIETRVLFWVAGNEIGLNAYRDGQDLYKIMAAAIYKKSVKEITKPERQLGKTAILGCGYGMGAKKFLATCLQQGIDVSEEMAEQAVKSYRELYEAVPTVWKNYEKAACIAVAEKRKVAINKVIFSVKDNFLWCQLPSGRKLAYYAPQLIEKDMPWGEKRPVLHYMAVNSLTKKWGLESTYGGKITENIVQAISRDLMRDAMLRMDAKGFTVLLSVHDELVCEQDENFMSVHDYEQLMAENPPWAKGAPIAVEGFKNFRYKK